MEDDLFSDKSELDIDEESVDDSCSDINEDFLDFDDETASPKPEIDNSKDLNSTAAEENKLSFKLGEDYNSPVYIQRYQAVAKIIGDPIPGTDTKIKTMVDFGCAELNFFKYLKNLPSLRQMSFVDIDRHLLQGAQVKTRPLAFDYLHRRKKSLTVRVFAGSVAEEDERVQGVDAVTCIELIEHLHEDVLRDLPSVIFGYIQPKIVAITTPNVEFNVLFPDSTGFRHWDHKFEWTRLQFRKWCLSVVDQFTDYMFTVSGIGEGPPGSEYLGCCSQMAVFTRKNPRKQTEENANPTPYNLIVEHTYPSERRNKRSATEEILLNAEYYIHMLGKYMIDTEADGDTVQLPLKKILEFPKMLQLNCDEDQLGKILSEKGWEVSQEDGSWSLVYTCEEEEDSEEEEDAIHVGDGDTQVSLYMDVIRGINLDEMNAAGDGLEDWDASLT